MAGASAAATRAAMAVGRIEVGLLQAFIQGGAKGSKLGSEFREEESLATTATDDAAGDLLLDGGLEVAFNVCVIIGSLKRRETYFNSVPP